MTDINGKKIIFVIGGPGSGKGTQCDMIIKKYGFCHLSSGELLRKEAAAETDRGKRLQDIIAYGQLVPLDIVIDTIKEHIHEHPTAKGFLLDGFPREINQAIEFESTVAPCTRVLYINITTSTMTKRIMSRGKTSGRSDDNAKTIARRLNTFKSVTIPVVNYYKEKNKLFEIEPDIAERSPDQVFEKICELFDSI